MAITLIHVDIHIEMCSLILLIIAMSLLVEHMQLHVYEVKEYTAPQLSVEPSQINCGHACMHA